MSGERQQPPHDLQAEACVLSHLMLHRKPAVALETADTLPVDAMYSGAHRRVLEAIYALARDGLPCDPVSVGSRLRQTGHLDDVGGLVKVTEIEGAQGVQTPDTFRAYMMVVRQTADRRELLKLTQAASAQLYTGVQSHREFLTGFESEVTKLVNRSLATRGSFVTPKESLVQYAQDLRKGGGSAMGTKTGIYSLDQLTGGVHGGDLTVIAARPGIGKTSLALALAEGVASTKDPDGLVQEAVIFSLEMRHKELAVRLACMRGGLDLGSMRRGVDKAMMQRFMPSAAAVSVLPMHIDDTPGLSVPDIRTRARSVATKALRDGRRVGIVVIDYLQLISMVPTRNQNTVDAIGDATKKLKELAKELDVPVILLSQLNRKIEDRTDKKPKGADLRGSGRIEEDADNIWFIHRDESARIENDGNMMAEIIISKQRSGPIGSAEVKFHAQSTRFHSSQFESRDDHHAF